MAVCEEETSLKSMVVGIHVCRYIYIYMYISQLSLLINSIVFYWFYRMLDIN